MAENSPSAAVTSEPQAAAEAAGSSPSPNDDGGHVETYGDADPFEGKPMTPKRGSTLRMIRKVSEGRVQPYKELAAAHPHSRVHARVRTPTPPSPPHSTTR